MLLTGLEQKQRIDVRAVLHPEWEPFTESSFVARQQYSHSLPLVKARCLLLIGYHFLRGIVYQEIKKTLAIFAAQTYYL